MRGHDIEERGSTSAKGRYNPCIPTNPPESFDSVMHGVEQLVTRSVVRLSSQRANLLTGETEGSTT